MKMIKSMDSIKFGVKNEFKKKILSFEKLVPRGETILHMKSQFSLLFNYTIFRKSYFTNLFEKKYLSNRNEMNKCRSTFFVVSIVLILYYLNISQILLYVIVINQTNYLIDELIHPTCQHKIKNSEVKSNLRSRQDQLIECEFNNFEKFMAYTFTVTDVFGWFVRQTQQPKFCLHIL